jgi:hypothetical protein
MAAPDAAPHVLTVRPVLQVDFQTVANDSVMYRYFRAPFDRTQTLWDNRPAMEVKG